MASLWIPRPGVVALLAAALVPTARGGTAPSRPVDRASIERVYGTADRLLSALNAAPWRRTDVAIVEHVFEADQTFYGQRLYSREHYAMARPVARRILIHTGILQPSAERPNTLRRRPDLAALPLDRGLGVFALTRPFTEAIAPGLGPEPGPERMLLVGHVGPDGMVHPLAGVAPPLGHWVYDPFQDEVLELVAQEAIAMPPLDLSAPSAVIAGPVDLVDAQGGVRRALLEVRVIDGRRAPVLVVDGGTILAGTIGVREERSLRSMRRLPGRLLSVDRIAFPWVVLTLDGRTVRPRDGRLELVARP